MVNSIIIFLRTDSTTPIWLTVDEEGALSLTHHGEEEILSTAAVGKTVIVMIPPEEVLLTTVQLPPMSRQRLAQALPFAVEEQVADDIAALHFAHGVYQKQQPLSVAIIAQTKMQYWLDLLQSWQIQPNVMTSLIFALPAATVAWQMVVHQGQVMVRQQHEQTFNCRIEQLAQILSLAFTQATSLPVEIQVTNYDEQTIETFLQEVSSSCHWVEQKAKPTDFYRDLAKNILSCTPLNLLQGKYHTKKAVFPQRKKLWQFMKYVLSGWLILLMAYPSVSYLMLHRRLSHLDEEINAVYFRHFPQARMVVAPKVRLQEKLQQLTSQLDTNTFLLLMGYLGEVHQAQSKIQLQRIDFQNEQLSVALMAPSSDELTTFTDALLQQGIAVTQQNVDLQDDGVKAVLLIGHSA